VSDPTETDTHPTPPGTPPGPGESKDFIRTMIDQDLATGKHRRVVSRFPPEPNGFLHVGHAKSICLNFGLAREYPNSVCHLRYDDTNPETEDPSYVASIQEDVRWLGFDWGENLFFASDYFERLYAFAEELIEKGLAYVDDLSDEQIREYRGTVTEAGRESPCRNRPVAENLDLFRRMRAGEFPDGSRVLRGKIDMAHPNMKMRDPLLYRIRHAEHYRRGDAWVIYPMYDFAHCLSDSIEGITHSLCTLEFENNREIYDWILDHVEVPRPQPRQTEFARLNLSYTVLSKRKLLELVREGRVEGWDDPRMPTLSGLRRRGYPPEAIRAFCDQIGVAKTNATVDVAQLEHAVRDHLNPVAPRVLCVINPLKVVIVNYPEAREERLPAPYFPRDIGKEGSRDLPFCRELWIEREDFMEEPPRGFHRLAPGREVRLRYAYFITCQEVVKDPATGEITELRCTYDPATRGGSSPDGRGPKGTIHWVSARHALPVEVRLYDRLFDVERPDLVPEGRDYKDFLNPGSLTVIEKAWLEPSVGSEETIEAPRPETPDFERLHFDRLQFERLGYFYLDPVASVEGARVYNRIVHLKDTWAKVAARQEEGREAPKQVRRAARPPAAGTPPPPAAVELTARQAARAAALRQEHGLPEQDAVMLGRNPELAALFEAAVAAHAQPQAVANWVIHEVARVVKETPVAELPFGGPELGELVSLIDAGTISSTIAKDVFEAMVAGEGAPGAIVEARELRQLDDAAALAPIVDEVLAAHPAEVEAWRGGKETLFGFLVGQVMRATRGKANPGRVHELLRQRLSP